LSIISSVFLKREDSGKQSIYYDGDIAPQHKEIRTGHARQDKALFSPALFTLYVLVYFACAVHGLREDLVKEL